MKSLKKRKEEFIKLLQKNRIPKRIVDAFAIVNQEDFFDEIYSDALYGTQPIPVAPGKTGDEPLTLARMIHYCGIKKDFHVLEIGTGSGYSTAIMAHLAQSVTTVEIDEELALLAKKRFSRLKLTNIRVFAGDGTTIDESSG
ncbi:MAG TPA: rRNA adenine N-6-methyltransferase family protein, partial [Spirochaetota bacterium]|nr:rRNA adenine N-6-methyltransferase family protein [Spirochaetota bacterium]